VSRSAANTDAGIVVETLALRRPQARGRAHPLHGGRQRAMTLAATLLNRSDHAVTVGIAPLDIAYSAPDRVLSIDAGRVPTARRYARGLIVSVRRQDLWRGVVCDAGESTEVRFSVPARIRRIRLDSSGKPREEDLVLEDAERLELGLATWDVGDPPGADLVRLPRARPRILHSGCALK
jgi:hypothetical protein